MGAIIAFPLIFHFSWKKLVIVASAISLFEGVIVYFVPIPDFFLLNLVFADPFCVVTGLSLIFYGAATTKLGLTNNNLKKSFIILGGVICVAYIIIPLILRFGLSHFLFAIWVYPHAMIFIVGASIFLTGIFQYLDETKINITPFSILGRTAFTVYYIHFILLLTSMLILMRIGIILSTTLIVAELAVTASAVWVLMYFYSKWRWGKPSNWYEK